MAIWDTFLTPLDKEILLTSGYGQRLGFGKHPAIIVIDATYEFVGDRSEPIQESVKRWRLSSGEKGWMAIAEIRRILDEGRKQQIPIIYTFEESSADYLETEVVADKNSRSRDLQDQLGSKIVEDIHPQKGDIVISKKRASAFFGTPLASYLIGLGIDTILVTGGTTSGCVRATVVDGQSYNFRIGVVREATFDRFEASHAISLFDIHAKYADVISSEEALAYLRELS